MGVQNDADKMLVVAQTEPAVSDEIHSFSPVASVASVVIWTLAFLSRVSWGRGTETKGTAPYAATSCNVCSVGSIRTTPGVLGPPDMGTAFA